MSTQQLLTSSEAPRNQSSSFVRWMWIWVVFGLVVVVVVIGFLIGIVRALESIDDNLFETQAGVVGAGGDVDPLPNHIQTINTSLSDIDVSLKPIPGQAGEIIAGLDSIRTSLQNIDASLKDTSASLVDTSGSLNDTSGKLLGVGATVSNISGSLVDTSNVLVNVLGLANTIEGTLEQAQGADSRGTSFIVGQIRVANEVLVPAQADTFKIERQLQLTNDHLDAICGSPAVALLPPGQC
jgi:methyl-accepting chemotaxis protein